MILKFGTELHLKKSYGYHSYRKSDLTFLLQFYDGEMFTMPIQYFGFDLEEKFVRDYAKISWKGKGYNAIVNEVNHNTNQGFIYHYIDNFEMSGAFYKVPLQVYHYYQSRGFKGFDEYLSTKTRWTAKKQLMPIQDPNKFILEEMNYTITGTVQSIYIQNKKDNSLYFLDSLDLLNEADLKLVMLEDLRVLLFNEIFFTLKLKYLRWKE